MYRSVQRRRPASETQPAQRSEEPLAHVPVPEPATVPRAPTDNAQQRPVERPEVRRAQPYQFTILPPGAPPPPTDGPVTIQPSLPAFHSGGFLPLQREQDLGAQIASRLGQGNPLPPGVQRQLEGGLGASLSGVRVHADGEADRLARSVQAVAFTTGSDIFFRQGAYRPETPEGLHLLAHEATHTIQQSRGPVDGTPHPGGVSISDPGDRFERAADAAASRAAEGTGSAIQRMGNGGSARREGNSTPVVVQRKVDLGKKYVSDMVSLTGQWNDSTMNQLDKTYKEYRKAPFEEELGLILQMLTLIDQWTDAHKADKDKTSGGELVKLNRLRESLRDEREKWYKLGLRGFSDLVSQVGFPKEYVENMKPRDFDNLKAAHLALEEGKMGEADTKLAELRKSIGDEANLLKSSLIRHHIGKVNPNLEKIINEPKYELKDTTSRERGKTHLQGRATKRGKKLVKQAGIRNDAETVLTLLSGHYKHVTVAGGTKYVVDAEARRIWKLAGGEGRLEDRLADLVEKTGLGKTEEALFGSSYTDMAKAAELKQAKAESEGMKNLPPDEFMTLVGYSAPLYAKYNNPLRQKGGQLDADELALTQLTVSGLNRLPAFKGKSYRHTGLIGGYSNLTVIGSVVTDMAFFSTAKLVPACASGGQQHEVLEIIDGKSGRDIGDASVFGKGEAEVLFKPGTRFQVLQVYKREANGEPTDPDGWTPRAPSGVLDVVKDDLKADKLKMIVVKKEV